MLPLPIGKQDIGDGLFSILAEDRRKHMAIFGKSGAGKTTLLRNMIALDIQAGLGVSVIDPHGGLIEELLKMIPRHRTNDVIYFAPYGHSRVPGINILEPPRGDQKTLVVSALISILCPCGEHA